MGFFQSFQPLAVVSQALQSRWQQLVPALFAERVSPLIGRRLTGMRSCCIGASLATRNTDDCADVGLTLINPWPGA